MAETIWPARLADAAEVEMWTVNVPGVAGLLPEAGVPGRSGRLLPGGRGVGDELDGDAVERRAVGGVGPGRIGLKNDVAVGLAKVDVGLGLCAEQAVQRGGRRDGRR